MIKESEKLFPCPCCGNKTLSGEGEYEICTICLWEDDPIQSSEPTLQGGANKISLIEARDNWKKRNNGNASRDSSQNISQQANRFKR